jgi:hypothetical protein
MGVVGAYYGGATGISLTNYATAYGTGTTATASLTTDDPTGNLIVAGMANVTSNNFTATVGTSRVAETSVAARVALLDNSSAGSLACTSTVTSCAWDVILLELRFAIGQVPTMNVVTTNGPGQSTSPSIGVGTALGNVYRPGQTFP